MTWPLRVAMAASRALPPVEGSTASSDRDRAAVRRWARLLGGRAVGWRGSLPTGDDRARLRHAGVVLAWVGRPMELPVETLVALATEGPILAVVEPPRQRRELSRWLACVAALRLPTLRIALCDVPDCLAAGFAGDFPVTLHGSRANRPDGARVARQDGCAACGAGDRCDGGAPGGEVTPLPVAVSNQFDLVEQPKLVTPTIRGATLETSGVASGESTDELSEADAKKQIWLIDDARQIRRFSCDNQGWTPDELAYVLRELGQAWLDVSTKARLDDFAADLRPLQQVEPAQPLPSGRWRPAHWALAGGDPFGVDESALRAELAALSGTVVDIGAGPIRYLQTLADRISTGAVRYLAVEPDLGALRRTVLALPGALLSQGVGEHLPLRSGVADHVLMLRSFNHLRDVGAAFAEATRVARPGATLLVVDNVAFGLLRTQEQITRARAISVVATPFEHYRNANAEAAVHAIEATGAWQITRVAAVRPGTANQWTVTAVRR